MKVDSITMIGLLRGKCIPRDMKLNESLAAYLVRQFDSLHERAEAAERERDDVRKTLAATQGGAAEAINHSIQLQAEIAQRDAAAQGAQPQKVVEWPKWIPVSERMPDNGLTVLVCQEGGIAFCAEVEGREFYPDEFPHVPKQGREITHWMDMPEPPAAPAPGGVDA